MLRLPVSFRTLLVWAFLLVALLPSMALVQMWWHLDQLTQNAESVLANVERWQGALRALSESDEDLERSARQWMALKDPSFQQLALGFANDMRAPQALLAQAPDSTLQQLLGEDKRQLEMIRAWLSTDLPQNNVEAGARFDQISANQTRMAQRLRALVDLQQQHWAERLRQERAQADHLAWFSVLLALVLAMLLGYVLFAPLGRLRQKIANLAQGVRGQSWQVAGPSDLQDLSQVLQRLDARLVQLEAEKASFFRQVSHELKTPLAAIHEAAALLADEVAGSLTPAQHEIVAIQQSNTATLRARVETLLQHDVARWLSQQVEFRCFSLQTLQLQRVHQWQALMTRRNLRIDTQLQADEVVGDEQKVQTILDNLLINALRYSPDGGMVTLASRREHSTVIIRVSDQGPGVSASEAERIFDPFFCGAPPVGESAGSGIGLTMARTFAQLMGGDVRLVPMEQGGACFELCWSETGTRTDETI